MGLKAARNARAIHKATAIKRTASAQSSLTTLLLLSKLKREKRKAPD